MPVGRDIQRLLETQVITAPCGPALVCDFHLEGERCGADAPDVFTIPRRIGATLLSRDLRESAKQPRVTYHMRRLMIRVPRAAGAEEPAGG